ncbi:MAG: flagellar export chaperone FlgN [Melioribacteraceae bacterium]|nr:flagellar export chaperone FlgN [Melioribacteraceae bacterium]
MVLEKLFETLEVEKKNLQKLKSVAERKQVILVSSDREKLEECTLEEERYILNVRKDEALRIKIIHEFYLQLGLKRNSPKLSLLANCLKGKVEETVITLLSSYEKDIKSLVLEISMLNHRNLFLIQHSRNFITETINILLKNKKKALLDRRV